MAPVGSYEALAAAVQAGAGSVYFGIGKLNMRSKSTKNFTLDEVKYKWINGRKIPCIFISAIKKENIEKLRDDIYKMVAEIHAGRYPFNNFLW